MYVRKCLLTNEICCGMVWVALKKDARKTHFQIS
nr:MAG TPA: hypothetical protein [Caudoviricetes sp.]